MFDFSQSTLYLSNIFSLFSQTTGFYSVNFLFIGKNWKGIGDCVDNCPLWTEEWWLRFLTFIFLLLFSPLFNESIFKTYSLFRGLRLFVKWRVCHKCQWSHRANKLGIVDKIWMGCRRAYKLWRNTSKQGSTLRFVFDFSEKFFRNHEDPFFPFLTNPMILCLLLWGNVSH